MIWVEELLRWLGGRSSIYGERRNKSKRRHIYPCVGFKRFFIRTRDRTRHWGELRCNRHTSLMYNAEHTPCSQWVTLYKSWMAWGGTVFPHVDRMQQKRKMLLTLTSFWFISVLHIRVYVFSFTLSPIWCHTISFRASLQTRLRLKPFIPHLSLSHVSVGKNRGCDWKHLMWLSLLLLVVVPMHP